MLLDGQGGHLALVGPRDLVLIHELRVDSQRVDGYNRSTLRSEVMAWPMVKKELRPARRLRSTVRCVDELLQPGLDCALRALRPIGQEEADNNRYEVGFL